MEMYLDHIEYITRKIADSSNPTLPNLDKSTSSQRIEKETNYTDHDRDFKDIMTKCVVEQFYKSDSENANFIQLISDLFNKMIETYCEKMNLQNNDILFLYKGGNVLRILALEAINSQPANLKNYLMEKFESQFKKSDADFTIYINPKLINFKKIYDDMSLLSFLCLNYIRSIFLTKMSDHFSYHKLNTNLKEDILSLYLEKLNKSSALEDPNNKYYGGKFLSLRLDDINIGESQTGGMFLEDVPGSDRKDMYFNDIKKQLFFNKLDESEEEFGSNVNGTKEDHLIIDDHQTGQLVYFTMPIYELFSNHNMLDETGITILKFILGTLGRDNSSYIYVSYNSTLDFAKSKFHLNRSKVNFQSKFQKNNGEVVIKNLNGELIDVSIIDLKTLLIPGMSVHEDLTRVREYSDTSSEFNMKFKSYSFDFFIHDLTFIIFENAEYPWLDRKYGKRLTRLCFLYLIDMLDVSYGPDLKERIKFVIILKSYLTDIKNLFSKGDVSIQKKIYQMENSVVEYGFKLKQIINHVTDPLKKSSDNQEEFITNCINFLNDVISNLNIMENFLTSLQTYLATSGLIKGNELYNFDVLGGSYKQKYLKYKQKYLKLKNFSK